MNRIKQAQYLDAALKLLPVGLAWQPSLHSRLSQLLSPRAEQLERVNASGQQLIHERMPGNAFLLLEDWEQFFGLPECSELLTVDSRRQALKAKDNEVGSFNKYYLEEIARQAGYQIQVISHFPHHCQRDCHYPLHPPENAWRVFIYTSTQSIRYASCLEDINQELVMIERSKVECFLKRFGYAHVEMIFIYQQQEET